MLIEAIFIIAVLLTAYVYLGYPAAVYALSRLMPRPALKAAITPKVSLIIAAHNEERDIAAKLENTLALDYPKEKLEIIVASDCSTDRTEEIVGGFAGRGVRLYRQAEHFGKTVAQNQAVKMSSGEILVFSDATTRYEPDALSKLVRSFADPRVGCGGATRLRQPQRHRRGTRLPVLLGLREIHQELREPAGVAHRRERLPLRRAAQQLRAAQARPD